MASTVPIVSPVLTISLYATHLYLPFRDGSTSIIVKLPSLTKKLSNEVMSVPEGLYHLYFGVGLPVALHTNDAEWPSVKYLFGFGKGSIFGISRSEKKKDVHHSFCRGRWNGQCIRLSIGRSKGQCFEYLHYCIVSLDKKLWSTLSLFAQPYKWVLEINSFTAGGIPEMDKHSIQERVVILLVT